MSTTLSVLHVLMAGPARDVNLPGHDVIVGEGAGLPALDPVLQDFWSAFPCPPPWNQALIFQVNWTACVGQAVGERLKWFLADRCQIPHDPTFPGAGEGEEEMEAPDVCSLPCIIMIALACLIFCLLIAAAVFCVCRKRPKTSSPTHQSALTAHPDNAKYYTSCHYASAPVMARPSETTLCGSGTETRLVNGTCSHQMSPYHQQSELRPLVTPQHVARCNHAHSPAHGHTHLTPLLVNVNGQTSVLRQDGVALPPSRSLLSYRRLDGVGGDYTSSSAASQANSDRSHTYESIGDGHFQDSLKNGVVITAGHHGVVGYLNQYPHADIKLVTPDFCDCECPAHMDFDLVAGQLDGYYSDRSTQTLPVRHFRHVIRDTESPFGGPYSFDIEDSPHGPRPDSRLSNRSRRRTSSGSHYSDRSFGGYREGQKRNVPALHPNYFDPPEPPAPDTFTS